MEKITKTFRSDLQNDTWSTQYIIEKPKAIWRIDLLGNGSIILEIDKEVSWWKRYWTKKFLNTKWKKV